MKKILFYTLIFTVSILFTELFSGSAHAIPAFARKYRTSCTTCHAPFPRLTAQGEAIRLNGYKMPDGDELYVKDQPLVLGAEPYKKVFPQAVWPSDIPGMPPIAVRIIDDVEFDVGDTEDSSTSFHTPEAEILSAGSLGEDMSFFVELEFEEAELEVDVEHEPGEDPTVETEFESGTELSAWLMWEDWFSDAIGDNHVNFRIGSIGMQDLALPNTRSHNRITRQTYLYADELRLHAHGSANMGVEINGFDKLWRYNVGILQGDGSSNKKDFFGVLSFKIGGLGYDGSGGTFEEGLTPTPSGYWRDDSILFGIFGMRGYIGDDDEKFDRYGADVRANYMDLSAAAGYIKGKNVRGHAHGGGVFARAGEADVDKDIWFAEAEYFVYPWLQPYVRYEDLSVDGKDDEDKQRVIAGAGVLARANVKFILEGIFYTRNEPLDNSNDADRIFLRLDYAL